LNRDCSLVRMASDKFSISEAPMHLSRFFRRGVVLLALLALAMPLTALADGGKRGNDRCKSCDRSSRTTRPPDRRAGRDSLARRCRARCGAGRCRLATCLFDQFDPI
jgi:hypothetical protein